MSTNWTTKSTWLGKGEGWQAQLWPSLLQVAAPLTSTNLGFLRAPTELSLVVASSTSLMCWGCALMNYTLIHYNWSLWVMINELLGESLGTFKSAQSCAKCESATESQWGVVDGGLGFELESLSSNLSATHRVACGLLQLSLTSLSVVEKIKWGRGEGEKNQHSSEVPGERVGYKCDS